MRRAIRLLVFICLLLSSCTTGTTIPTGTNTSEAVISTPPQTPVFDFPTPTVGVDPQPAGQQTPSPEPETTPGSTLSQHSPIQYTLQVDYHYGFRQLNVIETIDYQNQTGETLESISLTVEPNRQPGVFSMTAVTWQDGSPAGYTLDNRLMDLPLSKPLEPGQSIRFTIAYDLYPPQIFDADDENDRPYAFGYTDKQTNLVDWYPMVAPYQPGSGWMIHNPWYFGEHVVYEMSDFDVTIRLQEPPQSLVIAASAMAEQIEGGYHYIFKNARSFAWSASHEYLVNAVTVGDVTVYSYYFPFSPAAGEQALRDTAAALELYSELFGPYPHTTLSVVEADFLDGMEYDGLYFLSRGFYNLYQGTPDGYLTAIAVHETAHQWWYGIVSNDQAIEPWLDEAFCTYSEYLFYEQTYPELKDWWWSFRVDFFNPGGLVDGRIYDYNGFRPYVNAVYLNGARFHHELRGLVGDDLYFQFIKAYAQGAAGKIVSRNDFFDLLEQTYDGDLSELVSRYFHSP